MTHTAPMTYEEMMARAAGLAAEGDASQAAAAYHEAAAQHHDQPGPHYELGLLHHQQGEVPEAIACFERAAALMPQDASIWNNLGALHYAQGDHGKAEQCFRQAVALDLTYAEAWYGLGKTKEHSGEAAEAELAYRMCLRWPPHTPRARERHDALTRLPPASRITGLRIGFVSIWFERGQAYVTKTLRDALASDHETFVFARTGGVFGHSMLESAGFWQVPNLYTFQEYQIPCDVLVRWIHDNHLDAVVFNEEYDWNLVMAAKSTGARVLTYLDYYKDEWTPLMCLYDGVLCSTLRTYNLVSPHCKAFYTGWAVDTELFRPHDAWTQTHTFFHNAGWLGIGYRKMTPAVITAFDMISGELPEATLLVHAQVGIDRLPPQVAEIVTRHLRITYHVGTEPAPGLYHRGRILLFPSKLEGLGLPLLEGLASGMPAIATNAPPMNEFVIDGYNGLLVEVEQTVTRADNIAFPETLVSVSDLANKMRVLASAPDLAAEMGSNARHFSEEQLSIDGLRRQLGHVLQRVVGDRPQVVTRIALPAALPVARRGAEAIPVVHLVGAQETNYPWGFENRLIPALRELGCKVVSTDYRKHRHDLARRLQEPADLVLVCRGEGIDPKVIRSAPCPTALWYAEQIGTVDAADEAAVARRRELAHNIGAFDLVLSHDESNLDVYRQLGARRVEWLPTAAVDPSIHHPLDLPKIHDITFVGTPTPRREHMLEGLSERFRVHTESVWDPVALNRLYNQSKIVLNLHLSDLPNTETRIAEVLGAGAFLLTEELSSSGLLRDRTHYQSFRVGDLDDLCVKAGYYLAHEHEREAIAKAGHDAAMLQHTYAKRVRRLLDIGLSVAGKPHCRSTSSCDATCPTDPEPRLKSRTDASRVTRIVESHVSHLAGFYGMTHQQVEERLRLGEEPLDALWNETRPTGEQVTAFYETITEYPFALAAFTDERRLTYLVEIMNEYTPTTMRFLDYGAGIGDVGIYYAHEHDATLLDVPGTTQAFARFRAERFGLAPRFVSELDDLDVYDVVSAQDVLEHIPEPYPAVERMAAALRTGGTLVTSGFWFNPSVPLHLAENARYTDRFVADWRAYGLWLHRLYQGTNFAIGAFRKLRSSGNGLQVTALRLKPRHEDGFMPYVTSVHDVEYLMSDGTTRAISGDQWG